MSYQKLLIIHIKPDINDYASLYYVNQSKATCNISHTKNNDKQSFQIAVNDNTQKISHHTESDGYEVTNITIVD